MNLNVFLKNVDDRLSKMTEAQTRAFIHEMARTLSEDARLRFLNELDQAQSREKKISVADMSRDVHAAALKMCSVLEKISEGSRSLESEYNEEYDDWYNPDADEILINDPVGIIADITHACKLVHKCVDAGCYADAELLLQMLEHTEIPIRGDYTEYMDDDRISMQSLAETSVFDGDWNQTVLDGIYGCYMHETPDCRSEKIFALLSDSGDAAVSLEDLMQCGDQELPDFDRFLTDWQDYLAEQTENDSPRRGQIYAFKVSSLARRLLREAAQMNPTPESAVQTARKYGEDEPSLYLTAVKKCFEGGDNEQGFSLAAEALDKLKPKEGTGSVRAAIAEAGIVTAEAAGRSDFAEQLRAEKFRAQPTPEHYLDLALHCTSFDAKYQNEMKEIYIAGLKHVANKSFGEDTRSKLFTIAFLNGDFAFALQEGMAFSEPIGWTGTFMKEGMALFLLGSYEGESGTMPPAMRNMLRRCGIENFAQVFDAWHKMRVLPEEIKQQAIAKAEAAMAKRTDAILGRHRNYYGECADYIAAIGEVKESRGKKGSARGFVQNYYDKYTRYRAFRAELKRYL